MSDEPTPNDPKRIRNFVVFFKNYMSLSTMVTAALPIPVTYYNLIPTFRSHVDALSVYTPLVCFLLLAFIFYRRHIIARRFFPHAMRAKDSSTATKSVSFETQFMNWLPLIFILLCVISILLYHFLLSIDARYSDSFSLGTRYPDGLSHPAHFHDYLFMGLYMCIFIFAEVAFILMALKEYLQDLLGLSDAQIIHRTKPA